MQQQVLSRAAIPVDEIVPDTANRKIQEDEDFAALVDSIAVLGVLQPVHVKPLGSGKYELIDGERRWTAARKAGLKTVPCEVWPEGTKGQDALVAGVVLNDQRKAPSVVHVARRLREIKNSYGLTAEQLAKRIGMPVDRVKNYAVLFGASEFLLTFFDEHDVPLKVAVELVRFEKATNEARARKVAARYLESPLSREQIAALRKRREEPAAAPAKVKQALGLGTRMERAFERDAVAAIAEVTACLERRGYRVIPAGDPAVARGNEVIGKPVGNLVGAR